MTQQLIHRSPLGPLEIAGIGCVEAGQPFDVDDHQAELLLAQSDLYSKAPAPSYTDLSAGELKTLTKTRGIKPGTREQNIAALEAADAEEASA